METGCTNCPVEAYPTGVVGSGMYGPQVAASPADSPLVKDFDMTKGARIDCDTPDGQTWARARTPTRTRAATAERRDLGFGVLWMHATTHAMHAHGEDLRAAYAQATRRWRRFDYC